MTFQPCCLATGIGSLPHPKAEDAVRVVLNNVPDAPIWPQLPARGLNEQMEVQYNEGLPRVVIDRAKERMYIDTTGDTSMDLATFYEQFMAENLDYFRITPEFSQGIYAMESTLAAAGRTAALREGADHRADQLRADHRGREQARHLLQRGVRRRGGEGAGHEVPLADPEVRAVCRAA